MKELILGAVRSAQQELAEHVKPCDAFEYAVVAALGEISWDEAVAAITKYRATPPQPAEPK
jgi:hypothetical protein